MKTLLTLGAALAVLLLIAMPVGSQAPQADKSFSASVATPKPAICGHLKTGHSTDVRDKVFYSFNHCESNKPFDSRLECDWPGRRIGQCREATRAPLQGPRPKRGISGCPVGFADEAKSFGIGTKAINPFK